MNFDGGEWHSLDDVMQSHTMETITRGVDDRTARIVYMLLEGVDQHRHVWIWTITSSTFNSLASFWSRSLTVCESPRSVDGKFAAPQQIHVWPMQNQHL